MYFKGEIVMKNKKKLIRFIVFFFSLMFIIVIFVFKSLTTVNENLSKNKITDNNIGEREVYEKKLENEIKFDEEDLKSKIGIYLVYENFMQDYFVPNQEDENFNIVDYSNEAKVFIGYSLVVFSDIENNTKPTEEQVRKAIEEYCGEHYEKYVDTSECLIAFDGDNSYEFVEVVDYSPTGYCNEIEKIEKNEDGRYTVTFIYSRPSDSDFIDATLDKVPKYRKQFTFIYNPNAKYTKYQLTELSFLKGNEI